MQRNKPCFKLARTMGAPCSSLDIPAEACISLRMQTPSTPPLHVRPSWILGTLLLVLSLIASGSNSAHAESFLVYFGTYTRGISKGIYVSRLEASTGKVSEPTLAAETTNPSFLAVHPNKKFLYAVGEVNDFAGKKTGAVVGFRIDAETGSLEKLNEQPSGGLGPCHLSVDRSGRNVLVANYGGGSVSVVPIGKDGRLAEPTAFIQHQGSSVNAKRQTAPHAHGIYTDHGNRFVFVPDLGLDKVLIYRFDATRGTLTPNDPAFAPVSAGSGPRHLAFHPDGKLVYVINELTCTVSAFRYDHNQGALAEIQTLSTLPKDETIQPNFSTAELFAHPSGKFVYGSNRGHDTIAVFAVDETSGKLSRLENIPTGGKTPRGFGIDPTGRFLMVGNQGSDSVVVFTIDQGNGRLTPTGQELTVGAPVCVEFVPVHVTSRVP